MKSHYFYVLYDAGTSYVVVQSAELILDEIVRLAKQDARIDVW